MQSKQRKKIQHTWKNFRKPTQSSWLYFAQRVKDAAKKVAKILRIEFNMKLLAFVPNYSTLTVY